MSVGDGFPDWDNQSPPPRDLSTGAPAVPRWSQAPPAGPRPVRGRPAPTWGLVDAIAADLAPQPVAPPRGWRRWIHNGTFGVVTLGPSSEELRRRELAETIRSPLRGHFKIGTVGKGGVGKTRVAVGVGSIFAEMRRSDRVVAVDADPAFGKLGSRIDPAAPSAFRVLSAGRPLETFAELRNHLGSNAAGLFVVAGQSGPPRWALNSVTYRRAAAQLDRHFTISIVDCGSTLDSAVTREAMRDFDALIVVASPRVDGVSTALEKLQWLAGHSMEGLLQRTVIALNHSDGHADKDTREMWLRELLGWGLPAVEVPFDPHLRAGGVIDVAEAMAPATRQRFIEIAAVIAQHFADTAPTRAQPPRWFWRSSG
ncbi:MinD/ParA family ATP-binding protein [Mycobacterium hubeiense]|uniref:MinD/ParA family ATP-binding protein n=1 Tax=Mycobacterium hubeiense TaxID=1867256 RepID=UPI0011583F55|nr:MinD/ParA family protein [Mycobacterium sp. QGD 101]